MPGCKRQKVECISLYAKNHLYNNNILDFIALPIVLCLCDWGAELRAPAVQ